MYFNIVSAETAVVCWVDEWISVRKIMLPVKLTLNTPTISKKQILFHHFCHKVSKKEMSEQLRKLSIVQRRKADWGRQ